jgi:hypothetical protein
VETEIGMRLFVTRNMLINNVGLTDKKPVPQNSFPGLLYPSSLGTALSIEPSAFNPSPPKNGYMANRAALRNRL